MFNDVFPEPQMFVLLSFSRKVHSTMANLCSNSASASHDDIHICTDSVCSHYVQTESMKLLQVDIHPLLMQSQMDEGYVMNWFTKKLLNETIMLMRPVLESCIETQFDDMKKSQKHQNCVFTGENVRVACTLKRCQENNKFLIAHLASHKTIKNKACAGRH